MKKAKRKNRDWTTAKTMLRTLYNYANGFCNLGMLTYFRRQYPDGYVPILEQWKMNADDEEFFKFRRARRGYKGQVERILKEE